MSAMIVSAAMTYDVTTSPRLKVVERTSAPVSPTVVARIWTIQNTSVTAGALLKTAAATCVRRSASVDTHSRTMPSIGAIAVVAFVAALADVDDASFPAVPLEQGA